MADSRDDLSSRTAPQQSGHRRWILQSKSKRVKELSGAGVRVPEFLFRTLFKQRMRMPI
jgi:hypothetical protein